MHEESFAPREGRGWAASPLPLCLLSFHPLVPLFPCASVQPHQAADVLSSTEGEHLLVYLQLPRRYQEAAWI